MEGELYKIAHEHGYHVNNKNVPYKRGAAYNLAKKMEVAAAIQACQAGNTSDHPNITFVSRACKVSRKFVRKVLKELQQHGKVLTPEEKTSYSNSGPGARKLDEIDTFVILLLYLEEPSRSLHSYALWLHHYTGTQVSNTLLCRFFKEAFPFSGGLYRPNLIPFDKFRPENCIRAMEYFDIIANVNPHRIKFGDEKSLKGREVFNRKVRQNPLTGEVPPIRTTPDFTNTYSLTGFCGIDRRSSPIFCYLHEGTNDATEFSVVVELACSEGFFHEGDILVLDNAAIHRGGENSVLEDWLWMQFGVLVLFLPPRSPELNPIELVWNTMVQRLRTVPLTNLLDIGAHSSAIKSLEILNDITHKEIEQFYRNAKI